MTSIDAASSTERDLYARYAPIARAFFVRHGGGGDEEDLAHDAVIIAIEALRTERVRDPERIGGFLLGVCKNLVRERARRDERTVRALAREKAGAADADVMNARIDAFKLWGCINALNARARAVVLATYVDDEDADAIARAQSTSAGNVRVMRHRALAALFACLEGGAR